MIVIKSFSFFVLLNEMQSSAIYTRNIHGETIIISNFFFVLRCEGCILDENDLMENFCNVGYTCT